ncbi:MAG: hypothetical protein ACYTG7_10485 [Planctomycetota bacterium]|jgi:hypothetical protein
MNRLAQRFNKDLKADSKKTCLMVALGLLFGYLLITRLTGGEEEDSLDSIVINTQRVSADADTIVRSTDEHAVELTDEFDESLPYPGFLKAALPFEEIGRNPFKAFFKERDNGKNSSQGQGNAEGELDSARKAADWKTFEVECTITGGGEPFAIVGGKILRVNDEYKRFKVSEIGDGYVVFEGPTGRHTVQVQLDLKGSEETDDKDEEP